MIFCSERSKDIRPHRLDRRHRQVHPNEVQPKGTNLWRRLGWAFWVFGGQSFGPKNPLGGGNSNIFLCSTLFGEMIQFDVHIFQMG